MKILVVEDEEAIRNLIVINLQMVGYEAIGVEDGLLAKDFLEKESVDLILLDVMIPGRIRPGWKLDPTTQTHVTELPTMRCTLAGRRNVNWIYLRGKF